jgi:hypothetical protein
MGNTQFANVKHRTKELRKGFQDTRLFFEENTSNLEQQLQEFVTTQIASYLEVSRITTSTS